MPRSVSEIAILILVFVYGSQHHEYIEIENLVGFANNKKYFTNVLYSK